MRNSGVAGTDSDGSVHGNEHNTCWRHFLI